MTATSTQQHKVPKLYNHANGKYQELNSLNKTQAKFVQGQKYKIGTGLILVRLRDNKFDKIKVSSKVSYKKFLSEVLTVEKHKYDLVAIQWVPVRITREDKLAVLNCNRKDECIPEDFCKIPGCFCQPDGHCA